MSDSSAPNSMRTLFETWASNQQLIPIDLSADLDMLGEPYYTDQRTDQIYLAYIAGFRDGSGK